MLTAAYPLLSAIATVMALLVYMYMGINVGIARAKTGIEAPAMTGAPQLERAIRVHMNTLESMPMFLGGLWLATAFFSPVFLIVSWLPAALALVWSIGRIMYMRGYMADPAKRETGYVISAVPVVVNLILAVVGIVAGFWSIPV